MKWNLLYYFCTFKADINHFVTKCSQDGVGFRSFDVFSTLNWNVKRKTRVCLLMALCRQNCKKQREGQIKKNTLYNGATLNIWLRFSYEHEAPNCMKFLIYLEQFNLLVYILSIKPDNFFIIAKIKIKIIFFNCIKETKSVGVKQDKRIIIMYTNRVHP